MKQKESKWVNRFLAGVETVGNRMPHPVTIFVILCALVVFVSQLCLMLGVSAEFEQINTATGELTMQEIGVVSLLNPEGLRYMLVNAVSNFTSFAPLGSVLVAMLGVVVADGTGLIAAALRKLVLAAPPRLVTAVVVFAGIMSNIASDVGYVILVPLGAMIFLSFGRHPLAGLAAAFAGVSGGFSANLLIGTLDPMLSGLTAEAARIADPNYILSPTCNWYFLFVSTFIITLLGTFVTEKIVEPRLGEYEGASQKIESLTPEENKGLKAALAAGVLYVAAVLLLCFTGILANQETGSLIKNSPFMDSIVILVALFFLVSGVAYGLAAKTVANDKEIVEVASIGMSTLGGYLVLAFVSAQFVNYFSYTNLGTVIAVKGANFLETTGFTGIPLIIFFILVCALINLVMGSASAKWAIMAPVFVPMFMSIRLTPELTQVAYRIGDSVTNIISPLMSYFAMIIAFAQKYDKNFGLGTIIAAMLPYSVVFGIGWVVQLMVWYLFQLPLGPGAAIFIS